MKNIQQCIIELKQYEKNLSKILKEADQNVDLKKIFDDTHKVSQDIKKHEHLAHYFDELSGNLSNFKGALEDDIEDIDDNVTDLQSIEKRIKNNMPIIHEFLATYHKFGADASRYDQAKLKKYVAAAADLNSAYEEQEKLSAEYKHFKSKWSVLS